MIFDCHKYNFVLLNTTASNPYALTTLIVPTCMMEDHMGDIDRSVSVFLAIVLWNPYYDVALNYGPSP